MTESQSDDSKNITILPGVELYVWPGIHLLAILPTRGSAGVSDLLSQLGLRHHEHGDTTKLISKPIEDIVRAVQNSKGLLVGAHCNSTHGVVAELDGQPRLDWLRALDALELNSAQEEDKASKTIDYVTNALGVSIPFTFGSDTHDAAVEAVGMWVKMAEPSLTCLRQLVFEPQLRISRKLPSEPTHGRIVGFTTTHGIYGDQRFRFSPNLNVLLGGRGAGKSAAIDLLRFAFQEEPKTTDDNYIIFAPRIMGFLQSVGEVFVVVVATDGETYVISRSGKYETSSSRGAPKFTDDAQVYQVAGKQLILRDLSPRDVLGIEFYGQGEVSRLADRVDEQLRLVDETLDHSSAMSMIASIQQQLVADEARLLGQQEALEKLRVETSARSRLEERRKELAESLAHPIFAERNRWERDRIWLQGQRDWVQIILDGLPESLSQPPTSTTITIQDSSAMAVLQKVQETSDQVLQYRTSDLKRFREIVTEALSNLTNYQGEWNTAFDIADATYLARLAELGTANLDQAAAEQRRVERQLTHIQTNVDPRIEKVDLELVDLKDRRSKLLEELKDARTTINTARAHFVDGLNASLGGNVIVYLSDKDTSLYFDAINGPLQRSGMQHREEQISLICEALDLTELTEIIRTDSPSKLVAAGISENSAARMIRTLDDSALYNIERVELPILPSISIKREGDTEYTNLSLLSVGEKCSAILSIVLLSKSKPLVIDQPEDDLDHAFVINSIVEGIRTAKSERRSQPQLITPIFQY